MWFSKESAGKRRDAQADLGRVTIGGESVGVYASGESRNMRAFAPGGYIWLPPVGGEMLVLKCEDGTQAAAGAPCEKAPAGMENGEVCIKSRSGASILLKNDGRILIEGVVQITGGLMVNGNAVS